MNISLVFSITSEIAFDIVITLLVIYADFDDRVNIRKTELLG
jgi:hypothetical protein